MGGVLFESFSGVLVLEIQIIKSPKSLDRKEIEKSKFPENVYETLEGLINFIHVEPIL